MGPNFLDFWESCSAPVCLNLPVHLRREEEAENNSYGQAPVNSDQEDGKKLGKISSGKKF